VRNTGKYVALGVSAALILFAVLFMGPVSAFLEGGRRPATALDSAAIGDASSGRVARPLETASKRLQAAQQSGSGSTAQGQAGGLAEENLELKKQNRELQGKLVAVMNWILANFRGKYPLSEAQMSRLQLAPLNGDFTLSDEVTDFLKITPVEKDDINDALAYAHDYLAQIEAALITVTNPRPDKVILQIPTFPEEGKALQDDLYSAIDVTLGPARFDRFLTVAETGLNSNFAYFGEASRTMVFELAYAEDGSAPQLKIKDGWVIEVGPGTRSVTATETYVTNLPAGYSTYMPWLPEYIAAYANPQNM